MLGSGTMFATIESALAGMKAGDEKQIEVSFPADYPAENLKGKAALFAVKVKEVKRPKATEIDELRKSATGIRWQAAQRRMKVGKPGLPTRRCSPTSAGRRRASTTARSRRGRCALATTHPCPADSSGTSSLGSTPIT